MKINLEPRRAKGTIFATGEFSGCHIDAAHGNWSFHLFYILAKKWEAAVPCFNVVMLGFWLGKGEHPEREKFAKNSATVIYNFSPTREMCAATDLCSMRKMCGRSSR